jgi:predicted outer membrane repeat protein
MNGGEISGNSASSQGGGVYVDGTFRMSGGVIYGNTATPTTLRNTAGSGAALYKNPPGDGYYYTPAAEYGIINGAVFSKSGDINTTNTTVRIVNGNLQTN